MSITAKMLLQVGYCTIIVTAKEQQHFYKVQRLENSQALVEQGRAPHSAGLKTNFTCMFTL